MKKNDSPNNYLKYSFLGFQIVTTVLIGVFAGQWLDKHFNTGNNLYTIVCSVMMIMIALIQLIKKFLS